MPAGVEGFDKVQRSLRRMTAIQRAEIAKALDEGAHEVAGRARAIAPDDPETPGSSIAAAIEVRETLDGFGGTGAVGNFGRMARSNAAGLSRFVGVFPSHRGTPGWFAVWVEYGHAASGWYANQKNAKPVPARPFLRPAFHSLRGRVESRIRRAVNKAVREAARRG